MEQTVEFLKMLPPTLAGIVGIIIFFFYRYKEEISMYIMTGILGSKGNLTNHDLFALIDRLVNIKLFQIHFEGEEVKTEIFRDFIRIKLTAIKEKTYKFLQETNIKKISEDELTSKTKSLITDIVVTYNTQVLQQFIDKGLSREQAQHVIEIFDKWHNDTLNAVYSRVDNSLTSGYYQSNHTKMVAVLEIFAMAVELTVSDGVRSFKELNGYFKTLSYGKKR